MPEPRWKSRNGSFRKSMGPLGLFFIPAVLCLFLFSGCRDAPEKPGKAEKVFGPEIGHLIKEPAKEQEPVQPGQLEFALSRSNGIVGIPNTGLQLKGDLDELKKRILANAKSVEDLPRLFSTNVFGNPYLRELEFSEDKVVADIGCGSGALEVGLLVDKKPFKKLYAVDIDKKSLEILRFIVEKYFPREKGRIEFVHSSPDDVELPDQSVDIAIFMDAHFFMDTDMDKPSGLQSVKPCLTSLHRAMKPEGRVFVYETQGPPKENPKLITHPGQYSAPFLRVGFHQEFFSDKHGLFAFTFRPSP